VLEDLNDQVIQTVVEPEAREMRELRWERVLHRALTLFEHDPSELTLVPKGVDWKVAIARYLREFDHAPHRWTFENESPFLCSKYRQSPSKAERLS
jgi:hypothetical protein